MQIKRRIAILLKNMDNMVRAAEAPGLAALSSEISAMRERLTQPLKVAVVGFMKAGKSTLMNAVMQEKILCTGTVETTYTVSWFKYGQEKGLSVVMKDGRTIDAPFEDLEKWTVRDFLKTNPALNEVKYLIIRYPNELLKTMELIDTPGLFSSHGVDSANTLDFLGLQEAGKVTSEEAAQADAILYAFSRGVQGKDAEVLDAFAGAEEAASSPINAIGVFTRTDMFWDPAGNPELKPLAAVAEVVKGYKENSRLKTVLYDILPVAAKLVESAAELAPEAWDILKRLSRVEAEVLLDYLADASSFATEETDELPASPAERRQVLDLLTQYGVYTVIEAIRRGVGKEELAAHLYEESGIARVRDVLLRHFGNRSYLIKLNYVLTRLTRSCNILRHQDPESAVVRKICESILEEIEQVRMDEPVFRELEVLRAFYNGEFVFSDDRDSRLLLQITGEYGSSCATRLGMPEDTPLTQLRDTALALAGHWNDLANDFAVPRKVSDAAKVLGRSCEVMHYHLDMLCGY